MPPSPITHHPLPRRCIGLLGGSFNPAHAGHVQLSEEALKRLRLDEIWWLVSPQNPLKSNKGMAEYETRFDAAQKLTQQHQHIHISDIERALRTQYTFDTVRALQHRFPKTRFVWLMGSDNLAQFQRWRDWRKLLLLLPIAVFDRAPFSHHALRSKAAIALKAYRLNTHKVHRLASIQPPAFAYIFMHRNPASSTAIRNLLGKSRKQAHNKNDDT